MREVNLDASDQGVGQMQVEFKDPWSSLQTSYHGQDFMREKGPLSRANKCSGQIWDGILSWMTDRRGQCCSSVCNSQASAIVTPGSNEGSNSSSPLEERTTPF